MLKDIHVKPTLIRVTGIYHYLDHTITTSRWVRVRGNDRFIKLNTRTHKTVLSNGHWGCYCFEVNMFCGLPGTCLPLTNAMTNRYWREEMINSCCL